MEFEKKTLIRIGAGAVIVLFALLIFIVKEGLSAGADIAVTSSETKTAQEGSLEERPDEISREIQSGEGATEKAIQPVLIIVDVDGAVNRPGIVKLKEGSRVYEAVDQAGGLRDDADTLYINMAAFLTDGDKIYISGKEETTAVGTGANQSGTRPALYNRPGLSSQGSGGEEGKVNLNTADLEQLQALKGVGPVTAEKILDYRFKNGNFKKIEEIKNVKGIGEKSFEKLKDKICI